LGRLNDLSSSGAAIVVNELPPELGPVWIGLVGAVPIDWVEGKIVWSNTTVLGEVRVGLRFAKPCPNAFFRLAIWGKAPWEVDEPARDSRRPSGTVVPSFPGSARVAGPTSAVDDRGDVASTSPEDTADLWGAIRDSRSSPLAAKGEWLARLFRESPEPLVREDVLVGISN
jgi:hypothetical protein